MSVQVCDYPTLVQMMGARYPGIMLILPPLPETGRCGREGCGIPLPDPAAAPRGMHFVQPTNDLAIEVLLCPEHAGEDHAT